MAPASRQLALKTALDKVLAILQHSGPIVLGGQDMVQLLPTYMVMLHVSFLHKE